ncbi:hypothetical protein G5V59_21925 [Nocardioides sp. W3-2-3]|uniref:type I phosphomannose isomerase catalytic subunit n=1 Tax=Nocardioides convexus TaxID=2712224 RepID=UPI0024189EEF|nr:type I phosphomannose isomerase catalytic subunit [Nocardioides convexus]NHA01559.1 hypothetical protein [Nocardioides convexus]
MLALTCPTQSYDWGSTHAIPTFQRTEADGRPVAEVWVGTHPLGTARIDDGTGQGRPLTEVAGELGFMLKPARRRPPAVHPGAPGRDPGRGRLRRRGGRGRPARRPAPGLQGPLPQARDGLRADHLRHPGRPASYLGGDAGPARHRAPARREPDGEPRRPPGLLRDRAADRGPAGVAADARHRRRGRRGLPEGARRGP